MLSRIADALYWIARYMERAEDTARILDVNYYTLLEGAGGANGVGWEPLVTLTGERERFFARHEEATARAVFSFLGLDVENPSSIVQCVALARENARTIRDRISREMWEALNGLYLDVTRLDVDEVLAAGPHDFCTQVKAGAHRFLGVTDATFPRDDGWHFLAAGQALERAGMTARIVDVQYQWLAPDGATPDTDNHRWMAMLESVAAYEFYRRTYHTRIEPARVAELLVLHPHHPRSIRCSVATLREALRAIGGAGPDDYASEAERLTGRLHDGLKYDRIEDLFARGLHAFLADVLRTCRAIGEQLARTYFYYEVAT